MLGKDVKTIKTCLTVDLRKATVTMGKGESEDDKCYQHDQILQLVKSRSDKTRVGLRCEGKKRKDYCFQDVQVGDYRTTVASGMHCSLEYAGVSLA